MKLFARAEIEPGKELLSELCRCWTEGEGYGRNSMVNLIRQTRNRELGRELTSQTKLVSFVVNSLGPQVGAAIIPAFILPPKRPRDTPIHLPPVRDRAASGQSLFSPTP